MLQEFDVGSTACWLGQSAEIVAEDEICVGLNLSGLMCDMSCAVHFFQVL